MELTVIAAVVIGGMPLTGGEGYLLGGLFGVLITALIQSLIQFNGELSSWWTSIVIGALMLVFIGVQTLLTNMNARQMAAARIGTPAGRAATRRPTRSLLRDRRIWIGAVAVIAVFAAIQLVGMQGGTSGPGNAAAACERKPARQDAAAALVKAGAVITYERNGGSGCVDELYAIYPDGRITADNGAQTVEKAAAAADVGRSSTASSGWLVHGQHVHDLPHAVRPCFLLHTGDSPGPDEGRQGAVDGGTDAPAEYWLVTGKAAARSCPPSAPAP